MVDNKNNFWDDSYWLIYTFIINTKSGTLGIYFPKIDEVFKYFESVHNSSIDRLYRLDEVIDKLRLSLEDGKIRNVSGGEEAYFELGKEHSKLILTMDIEPKKCTINSSILLNSLVEYKTCLNKLESCQIPGIIPESKLDSWSCVPNEYIKEEWWEQQKQKEVEGDA